MRLILLAAAIVTLASCDSSGLDKQQWLDKFRPLLVDKACSSKTTYFRHCFEVDEAGCRSALGRQLDVCIASTTLPARLDAVKDGQKYGAELGGCAGNGYDHALASSRHNDAKCNDPTQWQ
jgi:hypothetical protein